MKNKPIQDKVGSILARSSVFLVSLFTISILVVTDISEVSARGRGGGGRRPRSQSRLPLDGSVRRHSGRWSRLGSRSSCGYLGA